MMLIHLVASKALLNEILANFSLPIHSALATDFSHPGYQGKAGMHFSYKKMETQLPASIGYSKANRLKQPRSHGQTFTRERIAVPRKSKTRNGSR